jgi:site-specific recombinase XerD
LTTGGVTMIVRGRADSCGLRKVHAHRLRHRATAMLRAGSPLREIGQVHRHRSALSTAIYAKVDRDALAVLARPCPQPAGTAAVPNPLPQPARRSP